MKTIFGILLLSVIAAAPLYGQSKLRLKEKSGDSRTYIGQVRISGGYGVYYDGSDFDGELSFREDKASRRKLPSNGWREGIIGLRPLREGGDILKMFGIPAKRGKNTCGWEGDATIDIKDFTAYKAGSEVGDGATLVRIISKSKPRPVRCQNPPAESR
jgi:hypothetical protein